EAPAHPLRSRPEEAEPGDPVLRVVDRRHAGGELRIADQLGARLEVRAVGAADPDEQRAAARDAARLVARRLGREADRVPVEDEPDRDGLARVAVGALGRDPDLLGAAEGVERPGWKGHGAAHSTFFS